MSRGTYAGTQRFTCNLPLSGLNDFSVHCWVYLAASQAANNRIFEMGDGSHGFGLGFQSAGVTAQVVDSGIAWRGSGYPFTTGIWTAIGITRAGGGVYQMYVNGGLYENLTAGPAALASFLTLGNDISATHSFNGYLTLFSVWQYGLGTADLAHLAKGESPLVIQPAYMRMHLPMCGTSGAAAGEPDWSAGQKPGNQTGNPGVAGQPVIAASIRP